MSYASTRPTRPLFRLRALTCNMSGCNKEHPQANAASSLGVCHLAEACLRRFLPVLCWIERTHGAQSLCPPRKLFPAALFLELLLQTFGEVLHRALGHATELALEYPAEVALPAIGAVHLVKQAAAVVVQIKRDLTAAGVPWTNLRRNRHFGSVPVTSPIHVR